MGLSQNKF